MKLKANLCFSVSLLCVALFSPLHSQPTTEQLDSIADLVEAGKLDEAKTRTKSFLMFYPKDPTLNQILSMLVDKASPIAELADSNKETADYWLRTCEALAAELKPDNWQQWNVYWIYGLLGKSDQAVNKLDELVASHRINTKFRDVMLTDSVARGLLAGSHKSEAMRLFPKISNISSQGRLAGMIAITSVDSTDTNPDEVKATFSKVESYFNFNACLQELKGLENDTYERNDYAFKLLFDLSNMAVAAAEAGFPEKANNYLNNCVTVIVLTGKTSGDFYSHIAHAYARIGMLDEAEAALKRRDELDRNYMYYDIVSLVSYWRRAMETRKNKADTEGARRLLLSGRQALTEALAHYEDPEHPEPTAPGYLERVLPLTLLQESIEQAIMEENPELAWRLFQSEGRTLSADGTFFGLIIKLYTKAGRTSEARAIIESMEQSSQSEATKEDYPSQSALKDARLSLAAGILAYEGIDAYESYVATLPIDFNSRFDIAYQNAVILAFKEQE